MQSGGAIVGLGDGLGLRVGDGALLGDLLALAPALCFEVVLPPEALRVRVGLGLGLGLGVGHTVASPRSRDRIARASSRDSAGMPARTCSAG
jgi:hypothetical protein